MLAKCSKVRGVIRLLDWYSIPEGFLIVMERPYPCIDMFDFIKGQGKISEDMARFLFRQIAVTVHECVQNRVLHRDLKVNFDTKFAREFKILTNNFGLK